MRLRVSMNRIATSSKLIAAIEKLKAELEIPKSIKEYGIDEATFLGRSSTN